MTSGCGPAGRRSSTEVNTAHTNSRYLTGITLPTAIRATTDPAAALEGVTTVLLGVPSQTLRTNLDAWRGHITEGGHAGEPGQGIELGSLMRMSQVIISVTGFIPGRSRWSRAQSRRRDRR